MKNAEDADQETIFIAVLFVLLIQQEPQSSPRIKEDGDVYTCCMASSGLTCFGGQGMARNASPICFP
jgi:hypothetical protein